MKKKTFNNYEMAIILIVSFFLIYFNLSHLTFLMIQSSHSPSALPMFTLDGISYFNGATEMIQNGKFFFTKDIYHSPGGQIWVSWVFRLAGSLDPIFIKVANFVLALLIQLIMFLFVKREFGWKLGLIVSTLIASSPKLHIYIATMQYEILLSFIVCSLVFFMLRQKNDGNYLIGLLLGFLCFLAFMLRYHYLWLALITALGLFKYRKSLISFIFIFIIFSSVFVTSYVREGVGLKEISENSARQLRWMSPLSEGHNFPYPPEQPDIKPGFHYIWENPSSYSNQLLKRFGYLFSIKKDHYHIPSHFSDMLSKIFQIDLTALAASLELLLILVGIFFTWRISQAIVWMYLGIAAAFLGPQLIVGSTSRFILPLLPLHIFFMTISFFFLGKLLLFKICSFSRKNLLKN